MSKPSIRGGDGNVSRANAWEIPALTAASRAERPPAAQCLEPRRHPAMV